MDLTSTKFDLLSPFKQRLRKSLIFSFASLFYFLRIFLQTEFRDVLKYPGAWCRQIRDDTGGVSLDALHDGAQPGGWMQRSVLPCFDCSGPGLVPPGTKAAPGPGRGNQCPGPLHSRLRLWSSVYTWYALVTRDTRAVSKTSNLRIV